MSFHTCSSKKPCPICRGIMASYGPASPSPSMETVEQSETVMAHRLWRWTASDGLIGPSGMPWRKSFMRAACLSYDHIAPHGWPSEVGVPCWCGVNAFKLTEPFELGDIAYTPGDLPVLGVVELGGIVDEYERGYRAEYGQIQELTVLTGLPVDTTPLEEKYDVPVRTMSFEDWRKEWELTYGRDRQSDTEDSDTETGTPPGITWTATSPLTFAGSSHYPAAITYSGTSPNWTNAQLNRLLTAVKNTPDPKWYQRWWYRLTGHNTWAWTREWWFLLFGGTGAVIFGMVGLLLPPDLRLVPWLVGAGVFLVCCGLDLILARKLRKWGFWR